MNIQSKNVQKAHFLPQLAEKMHFFQLKILIIQKLLLSLQTKIRRKIKRLSHFPKKNKRLLTLKFLNHEQV